MFTMDGYVGWDGEQSTPSCKYYLSWATEPGEIKTNLSKKTDYPIFSTTLSCSLSLYSVTFARSGHSTLRHTFPTITATIVEDLLQASKRPTTILHLTHIQSDTPVQRIQTHKLYPVSNDPTTFACNFSPHNEKPFRENLPQIFRHPIQG